jgi:toxin ParE1/3/4
MVTEEVGKLAGRMGPEFGLPLVRELIEGPYRVIYRVETERVEILAVFHGARAL